ncbi:hypothetical protein DSL72_005974 [Monilinia vaccinii-corymbosi]|uniref:MARVEL domain-containing protein n=1 Tax=Monilinia vaccinii-corymbosi TaxID=61207 RepID=A0A8A3PGI3_9HELO|nr:hypothetical protein DSL72_005974 [Monilinia vaccinii-corymbosi]
MGIGAALVVIFAAFTAATDVAVAIDNTVDFVTVSCFWGVGAAFACLVLFVVAAVAVAVWGDLLQSQREPQMYVSVPLEAPHQVCGEEGDDAGVSSVARGLDDIVMTDDGLSCEFRVGEKCEGKGEEEEEECIEDVRLSLVLEDEEGRAVVDVEDGKDHV